MFCKVFPIFSRHLSNECNHMPLSAKKIFLSNSAKKIYLFMALMAALFFLSNDVLLPWYVNTGEPVEVPIVIGLKFDDAKRIIDSLGLEARKGDIRMDKEHPAGTVVIQNPSEGSRVKRGRRIYLTLSGGELLVTVPDIKGRTLRDAKFALEREGLKLGAIEYQSSDKYPVNTIIEQRVSPGANVKRNVYISIVVSQGLVAEKVTVPDLNGKNFAEAQKILTSNGLKMGNITYVPSPDLLPNTVIQQFPLAGELVMNGQPVDVFVVQATEKKEGLFEN